MDWTSGCRALLACRSERSRGSQRWSPSSTQTIRLCGAPHRHGQAGLQGKGHTRGCGDAQGARGHRRGAARASAERYSRPQNLLYLSPSHNISPMLVQKVLPFVKSLSSRKWSDDDIVEDITYLKTELKERLEGLTWVPSEGRGSIIGIGADHLPAVASAAHTTSTRPRSRAGTCPGRQRTSRTTFGRRMVHAWARTTMARP